MNELQREFLDIVSQVTAHLEYQKALGVTVLETVSTGSAPAARTEEQPMVAEKMPETAAAQPVPRSSQGLIAIREELGECRRCALHEGRKTIVFGEGNPHAALVFVGEGPGYEEDQQGRPFVGEAGQLLTDIIVKGMNLSREDVYICNVVKCRPPENRNPELDEIEACGPFLRKQIRAIGPRVIVTLGNVPTKMLLNTKEGITRLRGHWQTYEGIPVMPTFHPAYLLRSPGEKKKVWEDIQKVMVKLGMVVPGKR